MDGRKLMSVALIGLVALVICCALASANDQSAPPAKVRETELCKGIVLSRERTDKSSAGRKAFKMQKKETYLACEKCCTGAGWKYHFFTISAAPYVCQCANKYRHVLKAD